MKRNLTFVLLCLLSVSMFAQKQETLDKIESFKDMYKVEGDEVVFTKVIDDIPGTKDEIYSRALSYFAIAYKSANDVIQMKDKDAGTVIGKGIFTIYQKINMITHFVDKCHHVLRIDAKDGRARVVLTVQYYDIQIGKDEKPFQMKIVDTYPFAAKPQGTKKAYAEKLVDLCNTVQATFDAVEKELKMTSGSAASSDW